MLLKLRGLKKKSQVQDLPLSLWFSQVDGSDLGKGCCFCPGYGFGSDKELKALLGTVAGQVTFALTLCRLPSCLCMCF